MTTEPTPLTTATMLIRVGHSPDPDDAFMFHALAARKIDTGRYEFRHELVDIETLNRRALEGALEVTAISLHAYPYVADRYALLPCGASMGDGYGPMIVAREPFAPRELAGKRIAVPGTMTTAFLGLALLGREHGFNLAEEGSGVRGQGFEGVQGSGFRVLRTTSPERTGSERALSSLDSRLSTVNSQLSTLDYTVVPFDRILDAVESGRVDAGLIIHEGQLTYAERGLELVADLGVWWQEHTGLPLPLGANAIRKDLGEEMMVEVGRLLKQSIEYALAHRSEALDYAVQYGRDLDRAQADRFVGMYVNDWTLDFGPRGREAVRTLLARGHEAGVIPHAVEAEFIEL